MSCITGKMQYLSHGLAEDALIDQHVRKRFVQGQGPVNVYECEFCGHWHLTSKGEMNERLQEEMDSGELARKQRGADYDYF